MKTVEVNEGIKPTPPSNPKKDSKDDIDFTFSKWSPDIVEVTEDTTYLAVYSQNKYYVTWDLDDGSTPITEKWDAESIPSYKYETPILKETVGEEGRKNFEDEYCYPFKEWSPKIEKVTSDVTYKAIYDEDKKYSIVTKIVFPDGIQEGETIKFKCIVPNSTEPSIQDFFVNWGDNSYGHITDLEDNYISHSYTDAISGEAKIYVYGSVNSISEITTSKDSQFTLSLSYTISSVPDNAFKNNTNLLSIMIPGSITTIGENAFESTTNLQSVTFGNDSKLEAIKNYAFQMSGLSSINIPKSVTSIQNGIFSGCSSLNTVTFEEGTTIGAIPNNMFMDTALATFEIPRSVTSIGYNAFRGSKLTNVTIPNTVKTIDEYAYFECFSLSKFKFESGSQITKISNFMLSYCSSLTSIELPTALTEIAAASLARAGLNRVTIPKSVTKIGAFAFKECSSLSEVNFENESMLNEIGKEAFTSTAITTIRIPKHVKTIGPEVFSKCNNIQSIEFESGSEFSEISESMFAGCPFTNFTLPDNVTKIGERAFDGCTNLKSITIPNKITEIGDGAFSDCTALSSVTFMDGIQLSSLGYDVFNNTGLTNVVIPKSVETLGHYSFSECTLLESVTFEEGSKIKTLGDKAFDDDTALTSFTIPNTVTSIGSGIFSNCSSLSSVTFEKGIELSTIPSYMFKESGITSIVIPNSVTTIGKHAFGDTNNLTSVTIPKSVINIEDGAFGFGYDIITPSVSLLSSVTFEENSEINSLGMGAFFNANLSKIKIPHKVKSIGKSAFKNNDNLAVVDLTEFTTSDDVPTIDWSTFQGCSSDIMFYVSSEEVKTAFTSVACWSGYANQFIVGSAPTI